MSEHIWIPDTQIKPGVPTNHIDAAANYICKKRPDVIIIGGDWYDLPSLSSYEKPGSRELEGRRVLEDIQIGNDVLNRFMKRIKVGQRRNSWRPRTVFLEGNHEYRMQRVVDEDPVRFEGVLHRDMFLAHVHPDIEYKNFLEIETIDGIMYSHYFCNPLSLMKNVLGGTMDNRLNKLKRSFTQGHQQTLIAGSQYLPGGQRIRGLVAGAFYQHDEHYAGPQGHDYWRGIIYKHEVRDGDYDLMEVSLKYLLKEYS